MSRVRCVSVWVYRVCVCVHKRSSIDRYRQWTAVDHRVPTTKRIGGTSSARICDILETSSVWSTFVVGTAIS